MTSSVSIGNQVSFKLRETIMVYESTKDGTYATFVTRNPVSLDAAGVPRVGAGTLISGDFLNSLLKELRGSTVTRKRPRLYAGAHRLVGARCSSPDVLPNRKEPGTAVLDGEEVSAARFAL